MSKNLSTQLKHKLHRRIIVNLLNRLYRRANPKELPDSINSIIIFAQEKLGDAILLLPFLNALLISIDCPTDVICIIASFLYSIINLLN